MFVDHHARNEMTFGAAIGAAATLFFMRALEVAFENHSRTGVLSRHDLARVYPWKNMRRALDECIESGLITESETGITISGFNRLVHNRSLKNNSQPTPNSLPTDSQLTHQSSQVPEKKAQKSPLEKRREDSSFGRRFSLSPKSSPSGSDAGGGSPVGSPAAPPPGVNPPASPENTPHVAPAPQSPVYASEQPEATRATPATQSPATEPANASQAIVTPPGQQTPQPEQGVPGGNATQPQVSSDAVQTPLQRIMAKMQAEREAKLEAERVANEAWRAAELLKKEERRKRLEQSRLLAIEVAKEFGEDLGEAA